REMPRRIAILGSFNWIAKRMNLEAFLALAAPSFEKAGGEILVVGDMPKTDARGLESRFKAVRVTGRVEDVGPYLKESRLGIIPERTGGGFKLKMLTYIFHRLPIACLEGSVAGLPLRAGEAFLAFPDMEHLAKGALAALDDLMLLDRLQEKAFSQCRGKHDWAERGAALAALLQLGRS
ncbi:MAG: glycosyltransferase family 4 protein, partial [Alphaproteobacteria bacterium]